MPPQGPRSRPPDLPNFEYESWLGGGGFADVFLYRQLRPARPVAIKVLRTDELDEAGQRAFDGEANLMARVSAHPYIVTIFEADVAPDGRPYLAMEYYSKPNYDHRRRSTDGTLAVQEVLRVGVRVASAVETAHRAGILHRDIKPANILVNEYDRPGLTDFGIAGALEGTAVADAQGVTVAYAPPEVLLDQDPGDERADVYALGATLYALLAGTAPFEIRKGDNTAHALLQRTLNTPVPRLSRGDVPNSLEFLLGHAMSKDPSKRPSSAEGFARALQGIERELRLAPTDFELAGAEPLVSKPPSPEDDDATRGRRIQVVQQREREPDVISGVPSGAVLASGAVAAKTPVEVRLPVPDAPPASDTVGRAPRSPPVETSTPASVGKRPSAAIIAAVAATVLALVAVGVMVVARGGGSSSGAPTTTLVDENALVIPETPDVPTNVTVTVAGGVAKVTWDAATAKSGDSFLIERSDAGHTDDQGQTATSSPAQIAGIADGEHPCFQVLARRGRGQSNLSDPSCAT